MRKYTGIEILRIICACAIPLLHIRLTGNVAYYLQQYVARLGVPFFFAISGMFLSQSLKKCSAETAWKKYIAKTGRLFFVWLAIYSPLLFLTGSLTLKEIVFKTPAFLWYIGSMMVASIPFCFIQNRKTLYVIAGALYIIGTIFGDTYKWLTGGIPIYEQVFITTRNGLFFALPIMLVGEKVWTLKVKHISYLIMSGILLFAEISMVGAFIEKGSDRSMYLTIPLFIGLSLRAIIGWNPTIRCSYLGGISTAIYLMQYGIITVGYALFDRMGSESIWNNYIIYLLVIIVPSLFYIAVKDTKVPKILF